jgi:O-antigen/teichoic acid export membrane protein
MEKKLEIVYRCVGYNLAVLAALWIAFAAFGPWLVPLVYGDEFSEAYTLSVLMMLGIFFLSVPQILNKFFSGIGRPEIKSYVRLINLPLKGGLLYWMTSAYGVVGAAGAFAVNSFSLMLLTVLFLRILVHKERTRDGS